MPVLLGRKLALDKLAAAPAYPARGHTGGRPVLTLDLAACAPLLAVGVYVDDVHLAAVGESPSGTAPIAVEGWQDLAARFRTPHWP